MGKQAIEVISGHAPIDTPPHVAWVIHAEQPDGHVFACVEGPIGCGVTFSILCLACRERFPKADMVYLLRRKLSMKEIATFVVQSESFAFHPDVVMLLLFDAASLSDGAVMPFAPVMAWNSGEGAA